MSAVLDAAYALVRAYPGGSCSLAPRMGKSATSLSHEVKGTGFAKFGLDDAVVSTVLSGDLRILNPFAAECECMVLPLPSQDAPEGSSMACVAKLAREFSELVGMVTDAESDGRITANELARVRKEWSMMVAAGQSLLNQLQAQQEADAQRPMASRSTGQVKGSRA